MKLAMETFTLRRVYNDETAFRMIKDAGFDAFDYSFYNAIPDGKDILGDDYKENATRLRKIADEIGIECVQAHAQMEFVYGLEMNESTPCYLRLVRAIEAAGILGAKNLIIHSIKRNERLPENVDHNDYNRVFFSSFIPYCEKYGVCVSVENVFDWDGKAIPVLCDPDDHQDFVRSINSKWINICVDVGHSAVTGYEPEMVIEKMDANLLKAVHIHDNDRITDQHLLPYLGSLHWDKIMAALKKIGYQGALTLEIIDFLDKLDVKTLPAALKFAEQTGRALIEKFEKN